MPVRNKTINVTLLATTLLVGIALVAAPQAVEADESEHAVYDEAAYTEYVADTMKKLDKLYLDFCYECGVDAAKANAAKQEFLVTVHELMEYMNSKFDRLDPKKGASLSPTEMFVSIHALTMLVDSLTTIQIEQMTPHPYNE